MRDIKYRAYDRRNKQVYDVVSIRWSYGDILREYYKNIPDGEWLPEEVVVILGNGKTRTFNYSPHGKTYLGGPNGRRSIYSHGQRDLHDLTLLEYACHTDKHKVDIYEGHILAYESESGEQSGDRYLVKWFDHGFVTRWYKDGIDQGRNMEGLIDSEVDMVVIGHINLNSDLLETA